MCNQLAVNCFSSWDFTGLASFIVLSFAGATSFFKKIHCLQHTSTINYWSSSHIQEHLVPSICKKLMPSKGKGNSKAHIALGPWIVLLCIVISFRLSNQKILLGESIMLLLHHRLLLDFFFVLQSRVTELTQKKAFPPGQKYCQACRDCSMGNSMFLWDVPAFFLYGQSLVCKSVYN